MAKTIITTVLTGAITPAGFNIPETPEQIVNNAYECWKAGAAIVHLHMRDDKGAGGVYSTPVSLALVEQYYDVPVVLVEALEEGTELSETDRKAAANEAEFEDGSDALLIGSGLACQTMLETISGGHERAGF